MTSAHSAHAFSRHELGLKPFIQVAWKVTQLVARKTTAYKELWHIQKILELHDLDIL